MCFVKPKHARHVLEPFLFLLLAVVAGIITIVTAIEKVMENKFNTIVNIFFFRNREAPPAQHDFVQSETQTYCKQGGLERCMVGRQREAGQERQGESGRVRAGQARAE